MIPVFDGAATRAALPFDKLIPALRHAFAGADMLPERHHHDIPRPRGDDGVLLLMPAWNDDLLGTKIATVYPGNSARHLPSVFSTYLLSDASSGKPLAILDGDEITTRRTIAVSALAASFLAREEAESLLIVGAGRIGALAARAFAAVRPIRRVAIWNRDHARAEVLASALRVQGYKASAVASLRTGVESADIISCATPSRDPLIEGEWLRPGTHLDLIGSFARDMREADDACVARAVVHVDTRDALTESGDLAGPIERGVIDPGSVGTLGDLCAGRVAGRRNVDDITLFKSVGTALADLVAAGLVHSGSPSVDEESTHA